MTELVITNIPDTWINSEHPGEPLYVKANQVQLKTGERRGLLFPDIGNIAGRTVLDAYLVGHAKNIAAQTITVAAPTERWSPGRVTWNNQPSVGTGIPVVVSATADGDEVELTGLDTLFQAVADGTDWWGLRLSTNSSSAQSFWSNDSGQPAWELHIVLSDVADAPTGLRPDGGDVGDPDTVLAWDPVDDQIGRQVQVDSTVGGPDDVSPDYDSTMVAGGDPEFDITGLHTLTGAGPHYWRVRVDIEGADEPSAWSDWAEFTVKAMPTGVVDSPTGPFGDVSPTIMAHLVGETLTKWKVIVTGPDKADVRAESNLQTSSTVVWTVPEKVKGRRILVEKDEGPAGYARIDLWGDPGRAVAVGQPEHVTIWVPLYLDESDTVDAPTDLQVDQYAAGDSRLVYRWKRTEAADSWLFKCDGKTFARVDAADVTVDGGWYEWIDAGQVSPLRPHTLGVCAIESGSADSSRAATVTDHSHIVSGFVVIPEGEEPIVLDGTTVGEFGRADAVATYTNLLGAEYDVFYGHPGLRDEFRGSVDRRQPDVWETLDRIETLKTSRNRTARLVWASHSIEANLRHVNAVADGENILASLQHNVRFGFSQVD